MSELLDGLKAARKVLDNQCPCIARVDELIDEQEARTIETMALRPVAETR